MDTSNPTALLRLLLPKTPLILKTAFLSALSLSPNAAKQDLRTEVTINVLRSLMSQPGPVGKLQRAGLKDPGIKGEMWISKVKMPMPEEADIRDKLIMAIESLKEGNETYTVPPIAPVEAEWTGYRANVNSSTPRLDQPEIEHYRSLMSEVASDLTVLYFHGGAYFLLDPSTFRTSNCHLAQLTGGRIFSVRYRLAPQNPFPAALLDALLAYLTLLSPPPGSFHEPVPASKIVFAGDSAGGGLVFCLLQTLLTLQREGTKTIRFHGKDVPIELPAAASGNAPWSDITRSMPSVRRNAQYDYLSPPKDEPASLSIRSEMVDEVWPTDPPRVEMYVDASAVIHPLVSPLAVKKELWKGNPPMYLTVGNETIEDECCIVARRMRSVGTDVVFDGFEGMPHCFSIMMPNQPAGKRSWQGLARFCNEVIEKGKVESKALWVEPFTLKERAVEFDKISDVTDEQVEELMQGGRQWRVEHETKMRSKAAPHSKL